MTTRTAMRRLKRQMAQARLREAAGPINTANGEDVGLCGPRELARGTAPSPSPASRLKPHLSFAELKRLFTTPRLPRSPRSDRPRGAPRVYGPYGEGQRYREMGAVAPATVATCDVCEQPTGPMGLRHLACQEGAA